MILGNVLKSSSRRYKKIPVTGISFDSRKVKKNYIFFAIDGTKNCGTDFIDEAIIKGAAVIVSSKKIKNYNNKIPFLLVKDSRSSLAEACSNYYKQKPKNIIAVTGTNGKSSVADFFYQILKLNKKPVASIGTLGILSSIYKKKTTLTSMDPISLHSRLEYLKKKKINNIILEASSHGLDQKRLNNLNIKVGIFTNLSQDHLDYHKNIKSYFNSKMHLFKNLLNTKSKIITDEDNKEFKTIQNISKKRKIKKLTIGSNNSDIKILENIYKNDRQILKILFKSKIFFLKINLIGYFQIKNLLMAMLAAASTGININKIFKQSNKIKSVPGRIECVANLNINSKIIIDFAHTPDALEQTLVSLRKQFNKKIVLVFGCGGDRDKTKRFLMGKIAKKYCKKIYVTDDNPRNENPKKIRIEIVRGCGRSSINIGDRRLAIKNAIDNIGLNEILLVAGKGHETTQDYGNKVLQFSDKKVIKEIVKKKFIKNKNLWNNFLVKKVFNKKNVNYSGVSINSKTVKKNNIFFAIKGRKNDGHIFVKSAIKNGAIKSIVSKKLKKINNSKTILVNDTFHALNNLAEATRDNSAAKIIGITGSAGKTTLKNLISFSLKGYGKVQHSPYSYNNKFGVPLSLANLKEDTKYGVFEIGMDKKGEIHTLSKIVKPEIAIITNIAEAHIKNFKSLKDIAKAKAEIINNIVEHGYIILNKDDKYFNFLSNIAKKKLINIISFSLNKSADVYLINIRKIKNCYKLKISVDNKKYFFNTKNISNIFIRNMLACISVMHCLNLDPKYLEDKFKKFITPEGRGDLKLVKKFKKVFKFLDESYNANPLSMNSAIENLSNYKKENNSKKIILLGDMMELGKKSKTLHKSLSQAINKSDIDKVFVYGKHIKQTFYNISTKKKGLIFNNLDDANKHLSKIINNNDLLMIKGSNATGLNKFSKNIKKEQINVI